MTDISEILAFSKNKTRVLLCTSHPSVAKLVMAVLDFYSKEADFFSIHGVSRNSGSDFVVFETSDLQKAAAFQPNIVLISEEINPDQILSVLQNITPGGVLVYPEKFAGVVESAENYFRKLPFTVSEFKRNDDHFVLNTEMGSIPLLSGDENLIQNIEGIKLLCQQFGVMEEEFYEPVMSFE
ncbi:hypothetical protein CBW16_09065 [Flavobacteriaceae bacterium JJC]|nr:hypothetical protein CBW16_09065 [Flavobacteriaceae bacterium JJC]